MYQQPQQYTPNPSTSNPAMGTDLNQIKNMIGMIKSSNNPDSMLQYLMASNPRFKDAMNLARQNGGSPKDAFYALAKQKGINPDEIIALLK